MKGKGADTIDIRPARSQVVVATVTPLPSATRPVSQTLDVLEANVAITPTPLATTTARPLEKSALNPVGTPDATLTPTPTAPKSSTASTTATVSPTASTTATRTPTATTTQTTTATPTTTGTTTPTATPVKAPPVSLSQYEAALLDLHNETRSDHDLKPFVADATLEQIARQRATTMAGSGSFSHYNPDGTTVFDMMNAAHYDYTDGAENIHYNFGYSDSDSVQVAMTAFLNSAPHLANILNPDLTRIGIGIAHSTDGKTYYSVVFSD